MATYGPVHGSHHGGWCWRKVTPLLRAAGHAVLTPTLTGLGERVHLAAPGVGLGTHIQGVVNVLEFEDLADVVLVGHSSGGRVITGVADRVPERLGHLVYLDAALPLDGESGLDAYPPAAQAAMRERARTQGKGWYHPVPATEEPLWGITDAADWAWVRSKAVPQPFAPLTERLTLTGAGAGLPGTNNDSTAASRRAARGPRSSRRSPPARGSAVTGTASWRPGTMRWSAPPRPSQHCSWSARSQQGRCGRRVPPIRAARPERTCPPAADRSATSRTSRHHRAARRGHSPHPWRTTTW
jgi:pimeloyl-ACP methyl ester carboxylesterase